jgi:hypothetical protein
VEEKRTVNINKSIINQINHKNKIITDMYTGNKLICFKKVHTDINLSDAVPIQEGLKQGDIFIIIAFQLCFRICYQEGP